MIKNLKRMTNEQLCDEIGMLWIQDSGFIMTLMMLPFLKELKLRMTGQWRRL